MENQKLEEIKDMIAFCGVVHTPRGIMGTEAEVQECLENLEDWQGLAYSKNSVGLEIPADGAKLLIKGLGWCEVFPKLEKSA